VVKVVKVVDQVDNLGGYFLDYYYCHHRCHYRHLVTPPVNYYFLSNI